MIPSSLEVSIDETIRGLARVALVGARPVLVGPSGPDLLEEMDRVSARLAAAHAGMPPASIPGLAPARDLYRAFGIDPTRTRPSSEALLRRVVRGHPLPRILNAVDLCNMIALSTLLPIGLYDAGLIQGPVSLRRGRPDESYQGIRKDEVRLDGRPILCDALGPFGNPTSDSLRTSVTTATRSLWMVFFAPARYPEAALMAHVSSSEELIARHLAPPGQEVTTSGRFLSC